MPTPPNRLLAAALVAIWTGVPAAAHADLAGCRTALFLTLDPALALAECDEAITTDPSDPQARFLRALARLAALPGEPAVDALADSYGLSEDGRFPPDANLLLPSGQLAPDSPVASVAEPVVASEVLPALDAALADLAAIDVPFTLLLTPSELATFTLTSTIDVEVDEGDAALLAALLEATRFVLLVGRSYDLDFDLDDAVLRFGSTLHIQDDILAPHPALFGLRAGAAAQMAAAKQALCAAIDSYHLGIQAIEAESDPQGDDLVAISDAVLERDVSDALARLRAALDRPQRILVGSADWKAAVRDALNGALGTGFGASGATLDLRALFDAPESLRPLVPSFGFDSVRHPPSFVTGYPDPTFDGALTAAAPGSGTSSAPCPPAVVPEPDVLASTLAGLLSVLGLGAARRPLRRRRQAA